MRGFSRMKRRRFGHYGIWPAIAGKGAHAGYGKQWIETLKAAIEIIPNPLHGPRVVKDGSSAGS
jgi:hypothetical protein